MKNHKLLVFLLCVSSSLFGLEWEPNWNRADFPDHAYAGAFFTWTGIYKSDFRQKYKFCMDSSKLPEIENHLSLLERIYPHNTRQAIRETGGDIDVHIATSIATATSSTFKLKIGESTLIVWSFFVRQDQTTFNLDNCGSYVNGIKGLVFTAVVLVERVADPRSDYGVNKISMAFYKGIPNILFLRSIGVAN